MKFERPPRTRHREPLHPILIMLCLMVAAVLLTHVLPAGRFQRNDGIVVAGTYVPIEKQNGLQALIAPTPTSATDSPARAAGVVTMFAAIPEGITNGAGLVFMIFFIGGMFGVLRATGSVDAGIDRLLYRTSGNIYALTIALMILIACGSSFLGLISEYVAIVPVVMIVGQRLGLPPIFAPAVVGVGAKIGYAASVSNPISLAVSQPLAGVPVFSGFLPRLAIFVVMLALGIGYVLYYLHRLPKTQLVNLPEPAPLTFRQTLVLLTLVAAAGLMVTGGRLWEWHYPELTAAFVGLAVFLAAVGGLRPVTAADAFVDGMKTTLTAGLLVGLAGAVAVILQSSQVLDSIVQGLALVVQDHTPRVVAAAMMTTEMMLDFAVPSLGAKAAISLPILMPIAHLNGVSGQVTVTGLLLGSGLNHLVSPTSAVLLAFLSISKVSYLEWLRFVAPLWLALCIVGYASLFLMVSFGV